MRKFLLKKFIEFLMKKDEGWDTHRPMGQKPKRSKGPPLCDVTVFKGPSGAYSVSMAVDELWHVDKISEGPECTYSDGRTNIRTIHPRSKDDTPRGAFINGDKAMMAAKDWSGVDLSPPPPVPNRRGLVAHTKAKS